MHCFLVLVSSPLLYPSTASTPLQSRELKELVDEITEPAVFSELWRTEEVPEA